MRIIVAICFLGFGLSGQTAPETTALIHARVIDGTGEPAALADTTVIVQAGRIASVYPSGSRPVPAAAKVEDLSGKWLIPGLIDAHVHLTGDRSDLARSQKLLTGLLLNGVTGVRDMAGDARELAYLARTARLEGLGWPDIFYSALMAGPTFFYEDARVAGVSRGLLVGSAPWARAVDATTDIRIAAAEARGTGATGVKLYANLSASLVKAITEEAHRQNLLVWTHAAIFPAKPGDAVDAGVDSVSHTAYLAWEAAGRVPPDYRSRAQADFTHIRPDDPKITALLARMKDRGIVLDATLRVFQQGVEHGTGTTGVLPWIYAVTRAAHQMGVLVDAGTDSEGLVAADKPERGAAIADELELLVKQCGFSAVAAIHAGTQVSAMAAGQEADRGSIQRGRAADLVVLTGDPLADIRNVRKVVEVFKDGKVFRVGGR